MKILLLSAPGVELAMPVQHLRASYNVPYISVAQLVDTEIRKLTKLGQQAESLRTAGQPIGDDLILGMIRRQVRRSTAKGGFILQGFPDRVAQAQALDALLKESGQALQVALWLTPAGADSAVSPVENPLFAYYRASGRLRVLALPSNPGAAAAALDTVFDKFAAGILPKGPGRRKAAEPTPSTVVTRASSAVKKEPAVPAKPRSIVKAKVTAKKTTQKKPVKRAAAAQEAAQKRPVGRPPKQAAVVAKPKPGRPKGSGVVRAGVKKRRV